MFKNSSMFLLSSVTRTVNICAVPMCPVSLCSPSSCLLRWALWRGDSAMIAHGNISSFQTENNCQKFSNQACIYHRVSILSLFPDLRWKAKRTALKIINSLLPVLVQATGEEESAGVKMPFRAVEFLKSWGFASFPKTSATWSSYR